MIYEKIVQNDFQKNSSKLFSKLSLKKRLTLKSSKYF